jgi:hypothetical protein
MHLLILLSNPPGWFDNRPALQRPEFAYSSSRTGLINAALPELAEKGPQIEKFYAGGHHAAQGSVDQHKELGSGRPLTSRQASWPFSRPDFELRFIERPFDILE